jgi:hypothetical protein
LSSYQDSPGPGGDGQPDCGDRHLGGQLLRPDADGNGGIIQPTGKQFAIHMVTVGLWNQQETMEEEFLFMDLQAFNRQVGIA